MRPRAERADSVRRATAADLAFLVFVPLVWGVNFTVIKDVLPTFSSPQSFNALRWILATAVLFLLTALRRDSLGIAPRDWGRLALLAGVGNVAQQLTFINGIRLTTAGHSALIMGLSPVMVAAASGLLRLERVDGRTWAGIVASLGGLLLLVRPEAAGVPRTAFLGDLLTVASAACWAVYTLASRPLTLRYPPAAVTALAVAGATGVLVVIGAPDLAAQDWHKVGWAGWAALLYSGALTIAFGYALWAQAVRRVGTTRTAIVSNLNPVVALACAWIVLGERLDAWQALGAALVVAGLALTRR
jgi:drug/metabolite transporter (DMT)-like permease